MSLGLSHASKTSYHIAIPVFKGPLDLLLQLIEKDELDITKISLALVTNKYLSHIHDIEILNPEEISHFLVVAAKLIQIKSIALLPKTLSTSNEEDVGDSLVHQLIEYRKYRNVAKLLAEHEESGKKTYLRLASISKLVSHIEAGMISIEDLFHAASEVFSDKIIDFQNPDLIPSVRITIREKIQQIVKILLAEGKSSFSSFLLSTYSRIDIVVTFLAVLELVKQDKIAAYQNTLFGEIFIEPNDLLNNQENYSFEFGE